MGIYSNFKKKWNSEEWQKKLQKMKEVQSEMQKRNDRFLKEFEEK